LKETIAQNTTSQSEFSGKINGLCRVSILTRGQGKEGHITSRKLSFSEAYRINSISLFVKEHTQSISQSQGAAFIEGKTSPTKPRATTFSYGFFFMITSLRRYKMLFKDSSNSNTLTTSV